MSNLAESCAQCGVAIPQSDIPRIWKDAIVCSACFQRLAGAEGFKLPPPSQRPPRQEIGVRPDQKVVAPASSAAVPDTTAAVIQESTSPRAMSRARINSARILLVLGIVMISGGTCLGGCLGLSAVHAAGLGSLPAAVLLCMTLAAFVMTVGFGIVYLVCRRKILQGSRTAAVVAMVFASIHLIFGALGVGVGGMQILHARNAPGGAGALAGDDHTGYTVASLVLPLISALLAATLIQLLVFLRKVLVESRQAAPETGGSSGGKPPKDEEEEDSYDHRTSALSLSAGGVAFVLGGGTAIIAVCMVVVIFKRFASSESGAAYSAALISVLSWVSIGIAMFYAAASAIYFIGGAKLLRSSRRWARMVMLAALGQMLLVCGLNDIGIQIVVSPWCKLSGLTYEQYQQVTDTVLSFLVRPGGCLGSVLMSFVAFALLAVLVVLTIRIRRRPYAQIAAMPRTPSAESGERRAGGSALHSTKPTLFRGGLAGYGLASVVGMILIAGLSIISGNVSTAPAMAILTAFGAVGSFFGFVLTAKRREELGIDTLEDRWPAFMASPAAGIMICVVLAGSFILAISYKFTFDTVYNPHGSAVIEALLPQAPAPPATSTRPAQTQEPTTSLQPVPSPTQ